MSMDSSPGRNQAEGASLPRRDLAAAAFGDDDGSADAALLSAIADGDQGAILAALTRARLLVPVVALLGEVAYDGSGLAHDKTSDMAVVLVTGQDGRRALLAFTSVDSMRRWQPDARPMPAATATAATAAVQEGASALVIDIAGPEPVVVETADLHHLAAAHQVIRLADGTSTWVTTP